MTGPRIIRICVDLPLPFQRREQGQDFTLLLFDGQHVGEFVHEQLSEIFLLTHAKLFQIVNDHILIIFVVEGSVANLLGLTLHGLCHLRGQKQMICSALHQLVLPQMGNRVF